MVEVSGIVQWSGWFVALLSSAIVIYKYYLKRPYIFLEMDAKGSPDFAGQLPIFFTIVNDGRRYAEDISIEIEFEGVNLLKINEDGNQMPSERFFGTFANYDQIYRPPIEAFVFDEEKEGFVIDEEKASRTNWILFQINDVVYSRTGIQFTSRIVEFVDNPATITYTIACRSHEPREGIIELKRDGDRLTINSTEPTLRRRIKRQMKKIFPEW